MQAHEIKIGEVFNRSRLLEIPFYQRSYVWREENWERFLKDMQFVSATRKQYFLGQIILKPGPQPQTWEHFDDQKYVVDGQQRLTTLLLFFKVLGLKNNEDSKFYSDFFLEDNVIPLRHSEIDQKAFDQALLYTKAEKINNPAPESQILNAFNYFMDNLIPEDYDRGTIRKCIQLVCIDLDKDDDEQQIFNVINSSGVDLTTADLLKNYFYHRENYDEFKVEWVPIFEKDDDVKAYWDQEIVTGRIRRSMIDIFFASFFQILIQDKRFNVKTEDKIDYDRVDALASSYEKFISKYCKNDKSVVLNEMSDYARIFMNTFNPDSVTMRMPQTPGIGRINVLIFGVGLTTIIPYVLYIEKNVSDENERNKIYSILESYFMRRMVVQGTTKNYNRFSSALINNEIRTSDDLENRLLQSHEATTYIPTDKDLENGFKTSRLINAQSASILYFIEAALQPESSAMALLGLKNYSLEHMMPKKWRNHWPACATDEEARNRDIKLLTLGNLAIIPGTLNTSIRDSDWNTKKTGKGDDKPGLIKCASGLITMQGALQKDEWNENEIDARAEWLYSKAKNIWNLNLPEDYEGLKGTGSSQSSDVRESSPNNSIDENDILNLEKIVGKNLKKAYKQTYYSVDGRSAYHLRKSKRYPGRNKYQYWYRFEPKFDGVVDECDNSYCVYYLVEDNRVVIIPSTKMMECIPDLNSTPGDDGNPKYYHIFFRNDQSGKIFMLLKDPAEDMDVSQYTFSLPKE